ncbi:MAG: metallopeptidase family protein [Acetobacteraceae bacterium]|nr:metallopeptidase family protein [Acetobacteraceae bacterium]MBV8589508.1 metallopeptidase family protein [Acetobacteraceae bacterium]
MAEDALAAIPAQLRKHISGTSIAVEEMPDEETLSEMGVENPWELTGLYRGVPLIHRSVTDIARHPDMIFLYREPILLEWIETRVDLFRLVRSVLIHEVGHHFGFSDAEIAAIEQEMDR